MIPFVRSVGSKLPIVSIGDKNSSILFRRGLYTQFFKDFDLFPHKNATFDPGAYDEKLRRIKKKILQAGGKTHFNPVGGRNPALPGMYTTL